MSGSCVRLLCAMVVCVIVTGCGGRSELPLNQAQQVPAATSTALAADVAPTAIDPSASYVLNPLDVVRIDVFGEPELSFANLPLDTGGTIVLPMIGTVKASGLTAAQLAQQLTQRLNRYLREPKVSVNVLEFSSQKVTVSGAVNRPGQYVSPGGISLVQAVAVGGGLNGDARADEAIVFREQGNVRYAARFDLDAIQAGAAADPKLLPGDTVVIGVSNARRVFRNIVGVLPFAAGVFIALIPRL